MKMLKIVLGVAFSLFLLLAIFFSLFFAKPFYKYEYNAHKMEIFFSGLSERQYVNYSMQIANYLFSSDDILEIHRGNGSVIKNYFTEREIVHMKDVKGLIRASFFLMILCLLLFVVCFLRIKNKINIIRISAFISIVVMLLLITASFINFNEVFIIFHKIAFRNDFWLLPENTKLIEMFPEAFFYDFAKIWLFLYIGINSAIYFMLTFYHKAWLL